MNIIVPLFRVGVEEMDLFASMDWLCPIPAERNRSEAAIKFFVDPDVIARLYAE